MHALRTLTLLTTLALLVGCDESASDKGGGDGGGDTSSTGDTGSDGGTDGTDGGDGTDGTDGTDGGGDTGSGPVDGDSDGYAVDVDCDDADPAVHPDAEETCDGVDSNCSGDETDAIDQPSWYEDADGDGYGKDGSSVLGCTLPEMASEVGGDCDDDQVAVYPGAEETCDGVDSNCSGDESDASDLSTWYMDGDSDGYGDATMSMESCEAPTGYVEDATDCDDSEISVNPGAEDECNGVDDNCSGDEDDATDAPTWYRDFDEDGYGDPDSYRVSCVQPAGSVDNRADCDDSEGSVYPGAEEVCDGLDNNCSGDETDAVDAPSWYADGDGDTYGAGAVLATACTGPAGSVDNNTDCDDTNAAVVEGPLWEVDADGDGFSGETRACTDPGGTPGYFTGDCDDASVHVHPGAWDDSDDGIDNDCDGAIDMADAETASTPELSLTDDAVAAITWTTPVDFCGGSYTAASVSSNGRLLFTSSDTDYSETVGELTGDGPLIAPLWDDLNPADSDSDGVYVVRYANALGVYWRVAEFSASASQYVSLLLFYDGFMLFEYDGLTTTDGLIGWSCATTTTETDLSAQVPYDGAFGIGDGVDAGIFELFGGSTSSDPNGMEDKVLWLCGTAGDDNDGDGYTDLCGDADDADNTVHP